MRYIVDCNPGKRGCEICADVEVVDNYTEGAFIGYNGVSRGDIASLKKQGYTDAEIAQARKSAAILEGALRKFELDTNIVTHRFERDVSWLTGSDNSVEALEKMIGKQYTAKGFTSSGMLPNRFRFTGGKSDAVHFEIVTPKGTDGAFLYMSKKGENEFLYNRNTRFQIIDGGERIVKEQKLDMKTFKMVEVDVKERFLKVQVVPNATASESINVVKREYADANKLLKETKHQMKQEAKKAVETFKFVPAETIEDAEKAISEFYNAKQFGSLGVSYKGLSLEVANEVNRALIPLYSTFDVDKMGGIVAPAGNTLLGKQISGAFAGYSPIRKGFVLNRKHLKDMKTATKAFAKEDETLKHLLEHPEQYDFSKLTKSAVELINRSKTSGRTSVPRTVGQALQHEFGHAIERSVFASDLWPGAKKNMNIFADRISGYAGASESEYVAESFVSYLIGEEKADPVMVQIFESLRRK